MGFEKINDCSKHFHNDQDQEQIRDKFDDCSCNNCLGSQNHFRSGSGSISNSTLNVENCAAEVPKAVTQGKDCSQEKTDTHNRVDNRIASIQQIAGKDRYMVLWLVMVTSILGGCFMICGFRRVILSSGDDRTVRHTRVSFASWFCAAWSIILIITKCEE